MGWLLYTFSPKLRRVLLHNCGHVLGLEPDAQAVESLARQVCANLVRGHYDLFRLSRLSLEEVRALTRVEGWENLERALHQEKGVIVVTAHLGNMDIMLQLPASFGLAFHAPAQHIQPERLFQYVSKLRQSHGVRLYAADGPLLQIMRALRRGDMVGLPCDRNIADNSREVEFFGARTRLPVGAVRLALHSGAPLVPAFALRLPDDTFAMRIEPQLELLRTEDPEADLMDGLRRIVRVMEKYISQDPEQWLVAAPVWPID
jgi:KDO2-lipid IV(A) lauroyltransferase